MTSVIYFVERESDKAVKIGISQSLDLRLNTLSREHGQLRLLGVISGGRTREQILHWCFKSDRLDGEFFQPTVELVELINQYAELPDGCADPIIVPPEKKERRPVYENVPEGTLIRTTFRFSNENLEMMKRVSELESSPFYGMNRTQLIRYAIRQVCQPVLAQTNNKQ